MIVTITEDTSGMFKSNVTSVDEMVSPQAACQSMLRKVPHVYVAPVATVTVGGEDMESSITLSFRLFVYENDSSELETRYGEAEPSNVV